jgi:hypothetical protein
MRAGHTVRCHAGATRVAVHAAATTVATTGEKEIESAATTDEIHGCQRCESEDIAE